MLVSYVSAQEVSLTSTIATRTFKGWEWTDWKEEEAGKQHGCFSSVFIDRLQFEMKVRPLHLQADIRLR